MVEIGRNGHAPGGIWLRFDVGEGFLYTGDYSRESAVYTFDEPPAAATVLLDASYGTDDRPLSFGQGELARMAAEGPVLLPAPADGRGPDMALFLHEQGYDVALDDDTRQAARMLAEEPGQTQPYVAKRLAALVRATRRLDSDSPVAGVMIAGNGTGSSGISAALIERWRSQSGPRIVFTGHVGKGTPAEQLVRACRAGIVRWNVHPRLQDNLRLARTIKARQIIPAFLHLEDTQGLRTAFGEANVAIERLVAL
jgi:Cft2 family RNA processing exonuclease